jgi:hypothetical protein
VVVAAEAEVADAEAVAAAVAVLLDQAVRLERREQPEGRRLVTPSRPRCR